MAIWVNCHMGWVIGLAVLVWWGIGAFVREGRRARTEIVAVVALSCLATLINPYGWYLWEFTTGVTHLSRDIQEWQPLWTSPVVNWLPSILAATLAIAALVRSPRLPLERVITLAGLAYVASQVHKFTALFVELTVLFLSPVVRAHFPAATPGPKPPLALRVANATALAVIAVMVAVMSWPRLHCLPSSADWRPDATVARALLDADPRGRIAIWFNWGEYAIWHFGPHLKVSFDPRYDLVYSPETIDEQENVARGTPRGTAFLTRTQPIRLVSANADSAKRMDRGKRLSDRRGNRRILSRRASRPAARSAAAKADVRVFPCSVDAPKRLRRHYFVRSPTTRPKSKPHCLGSSRISAPRARVLLRERLTQSQRRPRRQNRLRSSARSATERVVV